MFKPELNTQQSSESEFNTKLEAGRQALLADLEAAGEEGLRIVYYAADVIIYPVPDDPDSVTFKIQEGNHWLSGKRKFSNKIVSIKEMVLHSKYKDIDLEEAA